MAAGTRRIYIRGAAHVLLTGIHTPFRHSSSTGVILTCMIGIVARIRASCRPVAALAVISCGTERSGPSLPPTRAGGHSARNSTAPPQGNPMLLSSRVSHPAGKPHRANAAAITIWVFAVVEAIGIGYVLWTY
jgi:hypothetical protein